MSEAGTTTYTIRARLLIDRPNLSPINQELNTVTRTVNETSGSIRGGLGMAIKGVLGGLLVAAAYKATSALAGVGKALIDRGTEFETLRFSLTGVLMAVEGLDAATARQVGGTIFSQLREDAAAGVGELRDYLRTYNEIFTIARQSGATGAEVRQLTKLGLAGGVAVRPENGLQTAGFDISQALQGQVSNRITPIVMQALRGIGVNEEKFRALDERQRVETLLKAFGKFEGAAAEFGKTIEARSQTLSDRLIEFQLALGAPLLEVYRENLERVNTALVANAEGYERLASSQGANIAAVADDTANAGGILADTLNQIVNSGAFELLSFAVAELGGTLINTVGALIDAIPAPVISLLGTTIAGFVVVLDVGLRLVATVFTVIGALGDAIIEGARSMVRSFGDIIAFAINNFFPSLGQDKIGKKALSFLNMSEAGAEFMLGSRRSKRDIATNLGENLSQIWSVERRQREEAVKAETDALAKANAAAAKDPEAEKEKTMRVKLDVARFEWGNSRQTVESLERIGEQIANAGFRRGVSSRYALLRTY